MPLLAILCATILILLAMPARAEERFMRFGVEVSVTGGEILRAVEAGDLDAEDAAKAAYRNELVRILRTRSELGGWGWTFEQVRLWESLKYNWKITYAADGRHFYIYSDPAVLEFPFSPVRLQEFADPRDGTIVHMRRLFDAAATLGLAPDARYGGLHVHMGVREGFGNEMSDPSRPFRNFVVSLMNRSHMLAQGVMSPTPDRNNALTEANLAREFPARYQALQTVLRDYDESWTIQKLVNEITAQSRASRRPTRYYAVNLSNVGSASKNTIEFRVPEAMDADGVHLTLAYLSKLYDHVAATRGLVALDAVYYDSTWVAVEAFRQDLRALGLHPLAYASFPMALRRPSAEACAAAVGFVLP